MLKEMARIAAECVKSPKMVSVWVPEVGRYVCGVSTSEMPVAISLTAGKSRALEPRFKVVFIAAAAGTVFFTTLCVVVTLLAGKNEPALVERIVMSFADLAKIGFGAIVGMLGGKAIDSTQPASAPAEAAGS
jgi:hypothetical protein